MVSVSKWLRASTSSLTTTVTHIETYGARGGKTTDLLVI